MDKKIFLGGFLGVMFVLFIGFSAVADYVIVQDEENDVLNITDGKITVLIESNATTPVITEDFLMRVAMGEVPNAKIVHKFGRNDAISTSIEPVTLGANYRTPTSSVQLQVSSTSNLDSSTSTGARKITILGLNSTWQEIEIEVSLNGTTSVIIPNNFTRVYRAFISESGTYATQTTSSHIGVITIEEVLTGDDWAIIEVDSGFGLGQTQIGVYSIEKGCEGYLLYKHISVNTARTITAYFFQRQEINKTIAPYGTMRLVEQEDGITDTIIVKPRSVIRSFPELTDIGFMAKTSSGIGLMSVDFEILLICDHIVS